MAKKLLILSFILFASCAKELNQDQNNVVVESFEIGKEQEVSQIENNENNDQELEESPTVSITFNYFDESNHVVKYEMEIPSKQEIFFPGYSIISSFSNQSLLYWNTELDGSGDNYIQNRQYMFLEDIDLFPVWSNQNGDVENSDIVFLRDLKLSGKDQYFLLFRNDRQLFLSNSIYEDVIDPYLVIDESYKVQVPVTSRKYGFTEYPEHRFNPDIIAVKQDGYYGFINLDEDWIIVPQYEEVHPFKEGLAAVKVNGLWGYINLQNEIVIKPQYSQVYDYFNGLSVFKTESGKVGFIDRNGQVILSPNRLSNNINTLFSFYDKEIALGLDSKGLLMVVLADGTIAQKGLGLMTMRGGPINPFIRFNEYGVINVYVDRGYIDNAPAEGFGYLVGYMNRKGQWVIPLMTQEDHRNGLHKPELEQYYSELDLSSENMDDNTTYDNEYNVREFQSQFFVVDREGNLLCGPFEYLEKIDNQSFIVSYDYNRWGVIDPYGTQIIPPEYRSLQIGGNDRSYLIARRKYRDPDFLTLISWPEGQEDVIFRYNQLHEGDYDNPISEYQIEILYNDGTPLFPEYDFEELYEVNLP